ncbi:MAG: LemA family protein, partial [Planctomycetota bacterium]
MGVILIVGFVLVFLIIVGIIGIYNRLVRLRNRVEEAWAQIDVQLKRRHDLIPNLVETVRGYATHERQTLENVVKWRNQAAGATDMGDRVKAEGMLSGALSRLMVVVEQYPDLKANQNFLSLQEELTSTENKVGFARQHYNDEVRLFNTKQEVFPANIIAGMFRFKRGVFFEIQ